jgi:hypothetical protein
MRWKLASVSFLVLLSLVTTTGGAATGNGKPVAPRTLVNVKAPIHAFAQDADGIAWVDRHYKVHVRSLLTGASAVVGSAAPATGSGPAPELALAGTRALWSRSEGGNAPETSLWTSSLGTRAVAVENFYGNSGEPGGFFLAGVAGDGPTLAYGATLEGCYPPPWPPAPCQTLEASGGVSFVTGQYEQPPISGIPAPAMIALAAHNPQSGKISQARLAVVPAASPVVTNLADVPRAAENGPVQIYWFLNKLVLLSSVTPQGTVKAIALHFGQLAVLVQRADGTKALERYDAQDGALVGTTAVPKTTASELSTSSAGIVYRVGRKIYLLAGGTPRLVWRAGGTPIGLSTEGTRIAWAVNLKGRGRIVAVTLR